MKRILYISVLLLLGVCPVEVSSQTLRGDFDYDGSCNIHDVTTLISYLLTGEWDAASKSVVRDTVTVNGYTFVMVHVEGGSFSLGEGIVGTVSDFVIGQTEVTNRMWYAVMGSGSVDWFSWDSPKNNVSWDECQEFITRLNGLTGLQFRLPRSLEWSFAARGGNLSRGSLYSGSNNPLLVAWHDENTKSTSPRNVGLLTPNELGLYDMSGNVREWCSDATSSASRVVRGGDYYNNAAYCQVDWSGSSPQNKGNNLTGFRLAL